MQCPRDGGELVVERMHGIEVDHCPSCNGRWLDHHELDQLESTTRTSDEQRRGTIAFSKRDSELTCPRCDERMAAFDYRAYNLELDACPQEHGFWLDAGEDGHVRDIIDEHIRNLRRSASAEVAWGDFLGSLGGRDGGAWSGLRRFFGGRR